MKHFITILLLVFTIAGKAQESRLVFDSSFVGNTAWKLSIPNKPGSAWIIERSADSGITWTGIPYGIRGLDSSNYWRIVGLYPEKIHFIDDSTGFAFGHYPIYVSSYFLLRTGDGGKSWDLVSDWTQLRTNPKNLNRLSPQIEAKLLHFSDSRHGIVYLGSVGPDLVFLETLDKGRSWKHFRTSIDIPQGFHIVSMKFRDALRGEMSVRSHKTQEQLSYGTRNGGRTWLRKR